MNEVIQQLMNHRSIRKFKRDPIEDETLQTIIKAGQMASTSTNYQAYSVINITDEQLRQQIMELSGNQAYIVEAPVFLVWCADLYRLNQAAEQFAAADRASEADTVARLERSSQATPAAQSEGITQSAPSAQTENLRDRHEDVESQDSGRLYIDSVENMIVATVDTALAAQNAVVAAESLGLGVVYIGGVRNHSEQLSELLQLPELVYPLFGMCIGVPDQSPLIRPRLSLDTILHQNRYDMKQGEEGVKRYDQIYTDYMKERSKGTQTSSWSQQVEKRLKEPVRLHMKDFLQSKGFMKR